jgi:hypothetical protein
MPTFRGAGRQIYPDGSEPDVPSLSISKVPQLESLNKENDENSTGPLEWRLFESFFTGLKTHNDGGADIEEFVRKMLHLNIFKAEADALVFFKKLDINFTSESRIYLKQIESALEIGNMSIRRILCGLVRSVSSHQIQTILDMDNEKSTPRVSSVGSYSDLTARSSSLSARRNSDATPYKGPMLTPRQNRAKKIRSRDKVINRMITNAYATINESLNRHSDDKKAADSDDFSPRGDRRNSFNGMTGSSQSLVSRPTHTVSTITFRERLVVEGYLNSLEEC